MTAQKGRPSPYLKDVEELLRLSEDRHNPYGYCTDCSKFAADMLAAIDSGLDHTSLDTLWHTHLGPSTEGASFSRGWSHYLNRLREEAENAVKKVDDTFAGNRYPGSLVDAAKLHVMLYHAAATHHASLPG